MPKLEEEFFSHHSVEEIYNIVIDIERYPEFLPWCSDAHIISRTENEIVADLTISFQGLKESYRSKVMLSPPNEGSAEVNVVMISGPFTYLQNIWKIVDIDGSTKISFFIDFEFKSFLLGKIMGAFFSVACHKMVKAFEDRANELY
ncbi:MAG: putative oligoketide cyclase/dehydratase [Candidatus Midichloriaceae bacterium]|jgi:coenzyme Q-binding protein COQ10|nr:putative oligoketide cyclase/dehydratase [Candidatus Midichloriaceae bacterium]